ncbi:hypothetical protein F8388_003815 [Cannabis sativa]|uniref:Uncharacterized protein n=1 Tax=Cannabis sativa TaxID=3483 RepID=A0A7J6GP13_CANSA|nr:hypothetical protein F8388_003815 [Cannabis sativa]
MAATLTLLNLPVLPQKPNPSISISNNPTKLLIPQSQSHTKLSSTNSQIFINEAFAHLQSASLPLTALTLPFFFDPQNAAAAGGQFGLLEGRSFALVHPIVMGGLFVYTLWAGYLGWQWRRVRTIQNEINELKKQVKPVPVTPEGKPVEAPPSPVDLKIQQLTESLLEKPVDDEVITTLKVYRMERKELLKGSYRDRHFNAGSILLGFGVLEAVGGCLNTWLRTGKLFPGPHLFAGAGITVLWAAAAALVPAMQKGNDTARNLHIALNAANVLLFVWQIPTGLDIVLKVFEFTTWP